MIVGGQTEARAQLSSTIIDYHEPFDQGLTSIFGVVFFVSKSPVGIERQKKLEKFAILTRKPRSHA